MVSSCVVASSGGGAGECSTAVGLWRRRDDGKHGQLGGGIGGAHQRTGSNLCRRQHRQFGSSGHCGISRNLCRHDGSRNLGRGHNGSRNHGCRRTRHCPATDANPGGW